MRDRRWFLWGVQVAIAAVVGYFVYRGISAHWADMRGLDLSGAALNWVPLLAAASMILLAFGTLIGAWSMLVRGWGKKLEFRKAAAIWCLSNMGRYVPGKVWAVAGMTVLAQRAGVDPLAATGSAVLMQAIALGTGVAVALAAAPGLPQTGVILLGLAIAVGTVAALSSPRLLEMASRLTGREFRSVSPRALMAATGVTAGSWMFYGVAFWLIMTGVLGDHGVTIWAATGYFVASYIVGFVSVFVPGGIGVREGLIISLMAPAVGGAEALLVAAVARLVFTACELVAVFAVLPFAGSLKGMKDRG